MITVSAPGKMILLGEYAVLENTPALVCAVNVRARVKIEKLTGNEFLFSAPSLHLHELPFIILPGGKVRFDPRLSTHLLRKLNLFAGIMEYVYQRIAPSYFNRGLRIEINTDAFYSREFHSKIGFGSSAALCVALVQALIVTLELDLSREQAFLQALMAHHHAQGKMGSGIDIAASYFGGFLKYVRCDPAAADVQLPLRLEACPGLYFKPIFTGKSASTTRLVGGVKQLKQTQPQTYRQIMQQLQTISEKGLQAFEQGKVELFLSQVREFYTALKNLGEQSAMPIISEVHQKLASLAQQAGVAYKPSGAGSGDIGLIFSADPKKLDDALVLIRQHGFIPLEVQVDEHGVQVEKSF